VRLTRPISGAGEGSLRRSTPRTRDQSAGTPPWGFDWKGVPGRGKVQGGETAAGEGRAQCCPLPASRWLARPSSRR